MTDATRKRDKPSRKIETPPRPQAESRPKSVEEIGDNAPEGKAPAVAQDPIPATAGSDMRDNFDPRDRVYGEPTVIYRNQINDDEGAPFVRMVNTSGVVVPVEMRFVQRRLLDGYNFLQDESCVPLLRCKNQNKPECASNASRSIIRPLRLADADHTWLREMINDSQRFPRDPNRVYDVIERLRAVVNRRQTARMDGR